jgi:hypothetical protein
MRMKNNKLVIILVNIFVYLLVFGIIIYAKVVGMQSYDVFYEVVKEDGLAEYLTTFFLLGAAVIFGIRAFRAIRSGNRKQLLLSVVMVLLFVFGAGEELSWGQRLLNYETSEFFNQYNYQGETNLHNLELWGVNINKLIFSKLMFIGLGFYFLVLPLLVWKMAWVRRLVTGFGLPLPRLHHVIGLLAQNAIVLSIGLLREGELHELSLTSILFLVFLAPAQQVFGIPLEAKTQE